MDTKEHIHELATESSETKGASWQITYISGSKQYKVNFFNAKTSFSHEDIDEAIESAILWLKGQRKSTKAKKYTIPAGSGNR